MPLLLERLRNKLSQDAIVPQRSAPIMRALTESLSPLAVEAGPTMPVPQNALVQRAPQRQDSLPQRTNRFTATPTQGAPNQDEQPDKPQQSQPVRQQAPAPRSPASPTIQQTRPAPQQQQTPVRQVAAAGVGTVTGSVQGQVAAAQSRPQRTPSAPASPPASAPAQTAAPSNAAPAGDRLAQLRNRNREQNTFVSQGQNTGSSQRLERAVM